MQSTRSDLMHLVRSSAIAVMISTVASLSCHPGLASARSVSGCYAFERQDGRRDPLGSAMPDSLKLDSALRLNPDGHPHPTYPLKLEITTRRDSGKANSTVAGSDTLLPPFDWNRWFALAAWRFRQPDSVHAILHANMALSWMLSLRAQGDSLVGYAEQYSDYGGDSDRFPIVARRVACPTQLKAAT